MIAALYIDPRGPYPSLRHVDAWDATRDARNYDGPDPVVAHPPCANYGALRHLAVHDTRDLGFRAMEQVRKFGGVLEHPAFSLLLRSPDSPPDEYGGYTVEVCQCEWGHVARKRTWLYLVGVPRAALEPPPYPGREPTHWIAGGVHAKRGGRPSNRKAASPRQARRTPPLFAEYLVRLAEAARTNDPA